MFTESNVSWRLSLAQSNFPSDTSVVKKNHIASNFQGKGSLESIALKNHLRYKFFLKKSAIQGVDLKLWFQTQIHSTNPQVRLSIASAISKNVYCF